MRRIATPITVTRTPTTWHCSFSNVIFILFLQQSQFSEISSLLETSYTRASRFTDNANNRETRHLVAFYPCLCRSAMWLFLSEHNAFRCVITLTRECYACARHYASDTVAHSVFSCVPRAEITPIPASILSLSSLSHFSCRDDLWQWTCDVEVWRKWFIFRFQRDCNIKYFMGRHF